MLKFANGEPVDQAGSNTSTTTILGNADNSVCPDNCFRPTGLTFDSKGRLFMASDASGEIYVITQGSVNNSAPSTPTATGGAPSMTSSSSSSGANIQEWALRAAGLVSVLFTLM